MNKPLLICLGLLLCQTAFACTSEKDCWNHSVRDIKEANLSKNHNTKVDLMLDALNCENQALNFKLEEISKKLDKPNYETKTSN